MNRPHRILTRSILSWVLLGRLALSQSPEAGHVVLISIDGLAAYQLYDEELEIPHIRNLIREGVWAESSETVFPSVTHPSHTTLLTGVSPLRHGVIGNRLVNRKTGERYHITNRPHSESVKARTVFDAAKEKGLRTASFFWPENWKDPSVDYCIPEVFNESSNADIRAADTQFLQELRQAGVPIDHFYRWYGELELKGATDAILTEAAAYVLRRYKPHLLAIHLLAVDAVQHEYGTEHHLSKTALRMADYCVGILRQAAEEAGLSERTTFIVVSDHGFHTVRHRLNLYPIFAEEGLAEKVSLHASRWSLFVETQDNFDPRRDAEALEKVFSRAAKLPGVARIVRPDEFHNLGYPQYEENLNVRGQFLILSDIDTHLVVEPSESTTERRRLEKPYHGHGYLPSHPRMYPALLMSGHQIKRGKRMGHVRNHDVAPTIAHLLHLDMSDVEGRVMTEAITKTPTPR